MPYISLHLWRAASWSSFFLAAGRSRSWSTFGRTAEVFNKSRVHLNLLIPSRERSHIRHIPTLLKGKSSTEILEGSPFRFNLEKHLGFGGKKEWEPLHHYTPWITRWWFQRCFICTPKLGEMNPIWRAYFSDGLVQPPTRLLMVVRISMSFASHLDQPMILEYEVILRSGWPWNIGSGPAE